MKRSVFFNFFIFLLFTSAFSQLPVKRDDYTGTTNRNWWHWYNDGPSTPIPAVRDGYVLFSLVDPVASYEPFCDAALWDGYPAYGGPYGNCTVTLRVRALTEHKYGSRGWGLWYTEPAPDVQQQIWFMHLLDNPDSTGINSWRAETTKGKLETEHHYTDLDQAPYSIDNMNWHVYKIDRQADSIFFMVDDDTVLTVTEDLPDQDLAFHIWVDNLVYEHVDPDIINIHKRGWSGQNDIVLDYVQIVTPDGQLDKSEAPSGIKLLRQVPNEIYTSESAGLWKSYSFSSPGGDIVVLATARVEQYLDASLSEISGDDDIRLVIDGTDYGWNTTNSFNGDAAGTVSKTLLWEQSMSSGKKNLDVYGETSPLLYDVTVLGSSGGGIIYDNEFNETKSAGSEELWKEITFQTHGGEVAFYISASADEDPNPTNYGYQLSNFDNNNDDDLKIVIDSDDFGYQNDSSFWGNRQFGEPKSVLLVRNLSTGEHTLRLYGSGTPTLHRVVIFGENDDVSLPVQLSSFKVEKVKNGNRIIWTTESEVNNFGFNLFRYVDNDSITPDFSLYEKINQKLIPGRGNSSTRSQYEFMNMDELNGGYVWYMLQDQSYNGIKKNHGPVVCSLQENFTPVNFALYQNYPNPFGENPAMRHNHVTQIPFRLEQAGTIRLEIFDVQGRRVKKLLQRKMSAGLHRTQWDGIDEWGNRAASGVYLSRLQYNRKTQIRKMVLMR